MEKITTNHSRKIKLISSGNYWAYSTWFCKDKINEKHLEHKSDHTFDKQVFLNRRIISMNKFEICKTVDILLKLKLCHFWFFIFLFFFFIIFIDSSKNFFFIVSHTLLRSVVKHFSYLIFILIFRTFFVRLANFFKDSFGSFWLFQMILLNLKHSFVHQRFVGAFNIWHHI